MSNVISFTATVGREAEVRYTSSGMAVLSVSVANNTGFGDKQRTAWYRCTLFGKRAEGKLADYLKKGQQVFVSGELSVNEYTAKDGTAKYSLEVNANILDLVGGKREGGQQSSAPRSDMRNDTSTDNYQDFDDDIPFMRLQHEYLI